MSVQYYALELFRFFYHFIQLKSMLLYYVISAIEQKCLDYVQHVRTVYNNVVDVHLWRFFIFRVVGNVKCR
jgi:hypothetical protein